MPKKTLKNFLLHSSTEPGIYSNLLKIALFKNILTLGLLKMLIWIRIAQNIPMLTYELIVHAFLIWALANQRQMTGQFLWILCAKRFY